MKQIKQVFAAILSTLILSGTLLAQDTTMTITDYGYVGIGTVTPGSKLEVNGTLGAGDFFRFSNHMFSSRVARLASH